jgi:hypothetical protein
LSNFKKKHQFVNVLEFTENLCVHQEGKSLELGSEVE